MNATDPEFGDQLALNIRLRDDATLDSFVGSARHFVETWPREHRLPRRAIVGEPTSLRAVRMHKGHASVRLTFHGVGAHTGYPHLGKSAIEPAGRVITALAELRRALESEPCPNAEHFGEVPYAALNIGRIRGGTAINIVPDRCRLAVSRSSRNNGSNGRVRPALRMAATGS